MKRRWLPRFGIRTLLILTAICSLLMGFWVRTIKPYADQAASIEWVKAHQGEIILEAAEGPDWHRWLVQTALGKDAFSEAVIVRFDGHELPVDTASRLAALPYLRELKLDYCRFGDAEMRGLAHMDYLVTLSLRYTAVTDEGLAHVASLPLLKTLRLTGGANVTDVGIVQLAGCPSLRELYVRWTGVTPQGAEKLIAQLPECRVYTDTLVVQGE